MARTDLKTGGFAWNAKDLEQSVEALYVFATDRAMDAIDWYIQAKKRKKLLSGYGRLAAIGLATAGAVIPVLSESYKNDAGQSVIPAGFATVAMALAGMLTMMDWLLGGSSGWARYVTTELRIQKLLNKFVIVWQCKKRNWKDGKPSTNQAGEMCTSAKEFVEKIDTLIINESDEWRRQFESAVGAVDDLVKGK